MLTHAEQITYPFAKYARNAAAKRVGAITNMVHFCYEDAQSVECIPVYENLCFALSLLCSHTLAEVLEGKNLLQRFLAFQTKEGNFPTYIHNFPFGFRAEQAARIFLPLFILFRFYRNILGKDLTSLLEKAIHKLLHFIDGFEQSLPEYFRFRLFVYRYLFLGQKDHLSMIEKLWNASMELCLTSNAFSELLLGLQLLDQKCAFVQKMWTQARKSFHEGLQTFYLSSCLEKQQEYFPKPSLFDFFFIETPELIEKKFDSQDPIFLQAALVLKTDPNAPLRVSNQRNSNSRVCFCLPGKKHLKDHPVFRLLWSIDYRTYSLVCHDFFDFEKEESSIKLFSSQKLAKDGRRDHFDISFYCSFLNTAIYVEGKKATTFQLGEKVQFISKDVRFEMTFSKIDGDGVFFGHIFPSNRKFQEDASCYKAFDWKIGLRSVLGSENLQSSNARFCTEIRLL